MNLRNMATNISGEVAALLGLTRRTSVSVYRSRYRDFPQPVLVKNSGKCDLWARADIEAWARGRQSSIGPQVTEIRRDWARTGEMNNSRSEQ